MQDTAIKNFCIWARRELMAQVTLQAMRYGIREDGYEPAVADAIEGRPLTIDERRQRADLIRRLGPVDASGYKEVYENLVDQAAYTWFNRLIAIRFMELNDRLPSHVRVLSAEDGAFRPQVLREALDVSIEGLDVAQVSELLRASDDEALFRCLFLAQCRELSACLPDVFEPVGAAMELLLPEGLLRQGGVVQRLVDDIPEDDWREGAEIVGWMYQYYVSERKDEVFASFKKGSKADAASIAPATQLFTPDWIVRYLAENSLGRLWMQAHPDSRLTDQMPYYILDDLGMEAAASDSGTHSVGGDLGRPSQPAMSPESIKVIDPACGSGHILVYAFKLLAAMYEEAGHVRRDIPRLILQNNLTGCEIDPRAAQMASFALAMTACEWDSRFLRRADKVSANVVCLRPVEIDAEELEEMPYLAERTELLDAMAHMGECGSLFVPQAADVAALNRADDELDAREAGGDLLAYRPHAAVIQMLVNCAPLAETYDAVIANPPYMGSSNMDKWLANWTKKHYPDSKRDLCTCFIERCRSLGKPGGYSATVTSCTWMFISSFEALRERLVEENTIISMLHTAGPNNHPDVFDANAAMVLAHNRISEWEGSYLKLDKLGLAVKEGMLLEAIANPNCGWFYRRSTDAFKSIPGTPIAYWASDAFRRAFSDSEPLCVFGTFSKGIVTADNDRFLRLWWECCSSRIDFNVACSDQACESRCEWFPYNKGGGYRKWFGNEEYAIDWANDGWEVLHPAEGETRHPQGYEDRLKFKPIISWSSVSSSRPSFRLKRNQLCDSAGQFLFVESQEQTMSLLAFCNSSIAESYLSLLAPTMNYTSGDVGNIPVLQGVLDAGEPGSISAKMIQLAKNDWDSAETSWSFVRHPLV
ncbi:MAG: BREX-1 system adenine-specific DNA-methyltransferase PglX [Adlercreutzia sp.]